MKGLILLIIALALFTSSGFAQEVIAINAQHETDSLNDISNFQNSIFNTHDFNPGLVSDPFLLLQGKTPGVQIYNLGGDPNVASYARVRGISSFVGERQPLVVIDGIANASLENVDVNDIDRIEVLRKGSQTSEFGIRGSSGVIKVTTKSFLTNKKLSINFSVQNAFSTVGKSIPTFSAQEYLNTGVGWDEGSETNWFDKINRTAISNIGHLSISGINGPVQYRVSGNYRSVNGVLKNSGFNSLNTRADIKGTFLNEKLTIQLSAALGNKRQNFSFKEAYSIATIYNPTAPVYGKDAIRPFNSAQYGGYYELLYAFNLFNPLSIVEQNQSIGNTNLFNFNSEINYHFSEKLNAHFRFGKQILKNYQRKFYPTTALYEGYANAPINKGQAELDDLKSEFIFLESDIHYKYATAKSDFNFSAGLTLQSDQLERNSIWIRGFQTNDIDLNDDQSINQKITSASQQRYTNSIIPDENTAGIFLKAKGSIDKKLFLNANLRREHSSLLSNAKNGGFFGGFEAGFEMEEFLNVHGIHSIQPRIGYGFTGGVPDERGLALRKINQTTNADTIVNSRIIHGANEDLTWEKNRELNFGIDFSADKFHATVDFYVRNIRDLISLNFVDPGIFLANQRYENTIQLKSTGLEINLMYDVFKGQNMHFVSKISASTNTTVLKKYTDNEKLLGFFSGPGFASTNPILARENEEIGQIWGSVFAGVDANGNPLYADVNGDGIVQTTGDPLNPDLDYQVLGNALPNLELGWANSFKFKNWELAFLMRGVFGHSKINSTRIFNEVIPAQNSIYNFVNTELAHPAIKVARFHSLYVEKADFARLDYVSVGKLFNLGHSEKHMTLNCSIVGQNLLTLTGYTGVDPEPVLADFQYQTDPNELIPGIDRRVQYYPSKAVSLKIELKF